MRRYQDPMASHCTKMDVRKDSVPSAQVALLVGEIAQTVLCIGSDLTPGGYGHYHSVGKLLYPRTVRPVRLPFLLRGFSFAGATLDTQ